LLRALFSRCGPQLANISFLQFIAKDFVAEPADPAMVGIPPNL
jgi:hypothetical protein